MSEENNTHPCPECGTMCGSRNVNEFAPFCSARCKDVDLGKWFDGAYRIPVGRDETERDLPDEDDIAKNGVNDW